MLIALISWLREAWPTVIVYSQAVFGAALVLIITFAGFAMIFGAVGINISTNIGSGIANGIIRIIGYVFRVIVRLIHWILVTISRLIPIIFYGSRRFCEHIGINRFISSFIAVLVTVIFLAILI